MTAPCAVGCGCVRHLGKGSPPDSPGVPQRPRPVLLSSTTVLPRGPDCTSRQGLPFLEPAPHPAPSRCPQGPCRATGHVPSPRPRLRHEVWLCLWSWRDWPHAGVGAERHAPEGALGAVGVQTPCPHGLGDRRTLAALGMSCLVRAPCSRPGTSGQCVLTCGPGLPICPGPLRGWTEQGRPVTGAACQQADPGDPARPPLCRFDLHLSPHTLGRPLQGRESSQQTTGPNEGVGGAGRGRDLRGEGRGPRSHLCDLTCANVSNQPLWASGHRNVSQTAGTSPGRPFRGHDPRLSTNSQRGSQQHAHSAGVSRADPLTGLCSSRAPACLLGGELPGAERARAPPAGCLCPPVFRGNTSEGPSVCVQRAVRRHWESDPQTRACTELQPAAARPSQARSPCRAELLA